MDSHVKQVRDAIYADLIKVEGCDTDGYLKELSEMITAKVDVLYAYATENKTQSESEKDNYSEVHWYDNEW